MVVRDYDMKKGKDGLYEVVQIESVPKINRGSLVSRFGNSKVGRFIGSALVAGALAYGAVAPQRAEADIIRVVSNTGGRAGFGGSEMWIQNQIGGALGYDSTDLFLGGGRPPGSPNNWLLVSSDQLNQRYGVSGYNLRVDNRPFSGPDANQPFPLVLDTQGPDTITSPNNYLRFQLQEGPDIAQGREYYLWTKWFVPGSGASFTDGSMTKSGVLNLSTSTDVNLPSYNLVGARGIYGHMIVTPSSIPEPGTVGLLALGLGVAYATKKMKKAVGKIKDSFSGKSLEGKVE